MSSWENLSDKHIIGRQYSELVRRWENAWGENSHDEPSLTDYLSTVIGEDGIDISNKNQLFSAAGAVQSGLSDLIRLKAKADTAWGGADHMSRSGRIGWSNIDAHHASIMYMRYLCAVCGVYFLKLMENWHIVDVFPDFTGPTGSKAKKRFAEESKNTPNPIRILSSPTPKGFTTNKIEQRHFSSVLSRLIRTLRSDGNIESHINALTKIKFDKFKPIRNYIFYDGFFWPETNDLLIFDPSEGRAMNTFYPTDLTYSVWQESTTRDQAMLCVLKSASEGLSPRQLTEAELKNSFLGS